MSQRAEEHLPRLVGVVIDRLLAQKHQIGLFTLDDGAKHLRDSEGLEGLVGADVNGAVRADRHGDAQGVDGLEGTDGHSNDFVGDASLAKA